MKSNCNKGFTLIELTVVLFIVMIISNIAMASFEPIERQQLHSAAVEMQLNLRYAQNMALQEGTRYSIVFFVQNNSYIVRRMENGRYETIREVQLENVNLLNTTAVNNIVSFTSRGTTGNPSTITLQSGNYRVSLTISLGAGRVLIHEIIPL